MISYSCMKRIYIDIQIITDHRYTKRYMITGVVKNGKITGTNTRQETLFERSCLSDVLTVGQSYMKVPSFAIYAALL